MANLNKVILIGNVGKDPEIRHLEGGATVASFSLATNETFKNKAGEKVTNTEWHNIVLWRGLAEIAEKYVKKGTPIYIEGKIKTRSYDDKDGNKRYVTEIVGDNLQMLSKAEDGAGYSSRQENVPQAIDEPDMDASGSDLPF
ncbi:MAG TPA: single-stranded DNA-binding protein [Bacteroidales bacterium]|nr:MAG: single-stranded DNA-binding protein [Bacteroidetes bacterium GWF2_33_38]OFY75287.1 MAG: single-stranded DNA-binding protein [Bacteroidetes bacterium RIFOXYA12_FULL_33_9]HBF87814.1 single-stranded DNA-binding protein [Bacteroidales bacterium]